MLSIPDDLAIQQSPSAAGLWEVYPRIGPKAQALLMPELTPAQYLRLLVEHEQLSDALRFTAHALENRHAVYWGCLCWGAVIGPIRLPSAEDEAFEAAMRWVRKPDEENRRRAAQAGKRATMSTVAGCVATAASWSGGSLSREGLPFVPPRRHMSSRAVAAAVILTAAQGDYHRLDANKRLLLQLAMDVNSGAQRWVEPEVTTTATSGDRSAASTLVAMAETLAGPSTTVASEGSDSGVERLARDNSRMVCTLP